MILEAGGPISIVVTTRTDLPTVDYELSYEAKRLNRPGFLRGVDVPGGLVVRHLRQWRLGRERDRAV